MSEPIVSADALARGLTRGSAFETLAASIHQYGRGCAQWDGDPSLDPRTKSTLRPLLAPGMYAADANVVRDRDGNLIVDPGIDAPDGTLVRRAQDTAYDERFVGNLAEVDHAIAHGLANNDGEACPVCGAAARIPSTVSLMKAPVTPGKHGGSRSGRRREDKPKKDGRGRPYVEYDEPRDVRRNVCMTESTSRAIESSGASCNDIMAMVGRAILEGKSLAQIMGPDILREVTTRTGINVPENNAA